MTEFSRAIKPEALAKLQAMAEDTGDNWWKDLLSLWKPSGNPAGATGLRLAIRDNYLNFYSRGQSIAKVAFEGGSVPYVDTHIAYALPRAQQYARLKGGEITVKPQKERSQPYKGKSTLKQWIQRAREHQGPEKIFIDEIVDHNGTVIDLEMGQPAWGEQESALRIDLVMLEQDGDTTKVVFWEAKLLSDPRLRREKEKDPEILSQMENYARYLSNVSHQENLIRQYRENCRLLWCFTIWLNSSMSLRCIRSL